MSSELIKRSEEYRVDTEEQATALINQAKDNEGKEGYELTSYTMVKKNKKQKGEIIDEWVVVTLVKQW